MKCLGIDIGSTTVKLALIDEGCVLLREPIYARSLGNPLGVVASQLSMLQISGYEQMVVGLTGSGREAARLALGLPEACALTEIYAHALGAWNAVPGARTIVDIGGQDNKIIRLDPMADGMFSIRDFAMNELCAAGTGAFLEMHAKDLAFPTIEAFGEQAAHSPHPAKVAGRCSILAHSDVVHLRQAGAELDDIAAGLCRAVVLNVLAMAGGKKLEPPVLFQGGVASNAGVVRALREELGLGDCGLVVPPHHRTLGAIGAALHVARSSDQFPRVRIADLLPSLERASREHRGIPRYEHAPLRRRAPHKGERDRSPPRISPSREIVLGLDAGSASVKIAALDLEGAPVFTWYRLHEGRVAEALSEGLVGLREATPDAVVRAVAVTGSGRDLVGLRVGADTVVDEITAQSLGARMLDPRAEAVFEIGGQDSKFIWIEDGGPREFEMNRICAAGTGAFVLEASKILGARTAQEMDELAFKAERPAALSSRCCVFAKSDMVSLLNSGVPAADVAAGVFFAVANNYLNLVVGSHRVSGTVLFLGGLARTSAALLATLQSLRPDLEIAVPELCDVSGAMGAARVARDRFLTGKVPETRFRGADPQSLANPLEEFVCGACANQCGIKKWEAAEGRVFTGSVCGRYEGGGSVGKQGRNFAEEFLRLLRSYEPPPKPPGEDTIGVPRALLYYEQGPLWVTFLAELGLKPLVSDAGRAAVKSGGLLSPLNMVCLPVKVLLGQVEQLIEKGVKRVFYPTVVELRRVEGASKSESCMLIQASADTYLRPAFPEVEFVSPVFHYRGRDARWRKELLAAAQRFGADKDCARRAVDKAEAALRDFLSRKEDLGRQFLGAARDEGPGALLIARDYTCAPELDMGMARHFSRLGVPVAPIGLFPLAEREALGSSHFDLIFKSSQAAVLGAKGLLQKHPGVFPVVANQFLCRQDSCVVPFLDRLLEGRPSLRISLDENVGDAGLKTRCAAFVQVMQSHVSEAAPRAPDPFFSFSPHREYRRFRGVVWMNRFLRFYSAAYTSIGIAVRFFPESRPEFVEKGRRYFPTGEPCLPFLREVGQLEELLKSGEIDPERDLIHVAGTRHCASTTLPGIYKQVCERMGSPNVRIVSPREGLDVAEGVEAFGTKYVQNVARALLGEQYLKKLLLTVRPYEANRGEADRVYAECVEEFYESFERGGYFRTLRAVAGRLAGVATEGRGSRPRILVTGEYVVRNDRDLNDDIHRKIEDLGGEALGVPLFSDYSELLSRRRPGHLWGVGRRATALREFFLLAFLRSDIRRIKAAFEPHMPDRIEPDPADTIPRFRDIIDSRLDPVLLLEFYQAFWNMGRGGVAGIVNVHPFGCSISTSVEPLLNSVYGRDVPILSLSFDGQASVHTHNRLAAFMESVRGRSRDV